MQNEIGSWASPYTSRHPRFSISKFSSRVLLLASFPQISSRMCARSSKEYSLQAAGKIRKDQEPTFFHSGKNTNTTYATEIRNAATQTSFKSTPAALSCCRRHEQTVTERHVPRRPRRRHNGWRNGGLHKQRPHRTDNRGRRPARLRLGKKTQSAAANAEENLEEWRRK